MVLDDIFGAIGDAIGAIVDGVGDAVGDAATDAVSDCAMDTLGDALITESDGVTGSADGGDSCAKNNDLNVIKNTDEASVNVDKNVVQPVSLASDVAIDAAIIVTGIASTKQKEKQQSETDQQLND